MEASALSAGADAPWSAVQVMEPACAEGYGRFGGRGMLGSGSGGATYTFFFCVSDPASLPTLSRRTTGTRLTITDVFFQTIVASSAYSSSFCAFVSTRSMLRSLPSPRRSVIWRFRSPTLMNMPSKPMES